MKKIVFNDSRQIEIQSASASGGVLHVRMILTNAESLKALYGDPFATVKMNVFENEKTAAVYENYTVLKYVKEETGGVWEVEVVQPEADTNARLSNVEAKTEENATTLEMAIAELTILVSSIIGGGTDV